MGLGVGKKRWICELCLQVDNGEHVLLSKEYLIDRIVTLTGSARSENRCSARSRKVFLTTVT